MSVYYIDVANTFASGGQFLIPINPTQPRGMRANQPATSFPTINGPGGVQSAKSWFPLITFTWPAIAMSNANHAALLAAFQARQYVKTGLDYFVGILPAATKDDGFIFPTANKYIKIRIIEVQGPENPIENDVNDQIQDMLVTAIWMDAS